MGFFESLVGSLCSWGAVAAGPGAWGFLEQEDGALVPGTRPRLASVSPFT